MREYGVVRASQATLLNNSLQQQCSKQSAFGHALESVACMHTFHTRSYEALKLDRCLADYIFEQPAAAARRVAHEYSPVDTVSITQALALHAGHCADPTRQRA